MPRGYKGFPEYYDIILKEYWNTTFYEIKDDAIDNLEPGQICDAYVCYEKSKNYYLQSGEINPFAEEETKWKLIPALGRQPIRSDRLQGYNLETNEFPIVKVSKLRPVILLKKLHSDWHNPGNVAQAVDTWIVIPLFTYKDRHSQTYILDDQRLKSDLRFYMPPSLNLGNRIKESTARFTVIQTISTTELRPLRTTSQVHQMQKGFKISNKALKFLVYHFFANLAIIDELFTNETDPDNDYKLFKMVVNELIDKTISNP